MVKTPQQGCIWLDIKNFLHFKILPKGLNILYHPHHT